MRVKKKKHGAERMAACGDIVITDLSVAEKNPKNLFLIIKKLELKSVVVKVTLSLVLLCKTQILIFLLLKKSTTF
jgi:SepF-like predicted cell division protein (DUF552 family)